MLKRLNQKMLRSSNQGKHLDNLEYVFAWLLSLKSNLGKMLFFFVYTECRFKTIIVQLDTILIYRIFSCKNLSFVAVKSTIFVPGTKGGRCPYVLVWVLKAFKCSPVGAVQP